MWCLNRRRRMVVGGDCRLINNNGRDHGFASKNSSLSRMLFVKYI